MKKNLKQIILAVLAIAMIVGYYYYLTNRDVKTAEDDVEVTQLQEVLAKQLDHAYPPTPREVVKFYNRIIECAYGSEEYDTTQFNQLAAQARKLFDEELLESNPQEDYKGRLQQEIALYKENKRQILNTTICDRDEVRFDEIEGRKCAFVQASYFMKEGNNDFLRTYQKYLLRQDDSGNWKILAYHTTDIEEG